MKEIEAWKADFFSRIYDNVPKVFSWFDDWEQHGGEWQSHHGINGNGDGKTHIRKKTPFCASDWKDGNMPVYLVKLYADHHGINTWEAMARMAASIGIQIPNDEMVLRLKEETEAEEKKVRAIKMGIDALLKNDTPEAKKAAAYLSAHRGYKDASLVKRMGLGVITPDVKKAFIEAGIPCVGVYGDKLLIVPTYNMGKLASITIRNVNGQCDKAERYCHIYPTENKGHIHGIDTFSTTDLVLVEGEIDALHIKAMNALQWDEDAIIDVAAIGSNVVTKEARADIRNMARKKDAHGRQILQTITILFDAGEDEDGTKKREYINAIEEATNGHVKVFVASLPLEGDAVKMDADTFLNSHPLEDLKAIVDAADTKAMWMFGRVCDRYARIAGDNTANLTPKQIDAMEGEIAEIISMADINERNQIIRAWEGTGRDGNVLMMKADAIKAKSAEASTRAAAASFMEEAIKRIAKADNVNNTMDAIIAEMKAMKMEAKQSEVEAILHIPTEDEIFADWAMMREGIPMPYVFKLGKNTDECQQFTIPSGALTYVAAPTSNGKSCMLQNMALYTAAQCDENECILYFSFEESQRDTRTELLANYGGMTFSNRNKSTIKQYLQSGGKNIRFFKDKTLGPRQLQMATKEFLKRYITNGRIRIYDKDVDATHLLDLMMAASQQTKVKAIFIDYMQKMHDTNISAKSFGRDQELCGICDALNTFCNESGLPVVLAAQISRTGSKSPMEMNCNTIADASSIEKAAHAIILLYQNKGHYTGASKEWQPTTFLNRLKAKGIAPDTTTELDDVFPEDGRNKLWMRIDKYRGEESGGEMIFNFHGPTGRIMPNAHEYEAINGVDIIPMPPNVMLDSPANEIQIFKTNNTNENEEEIIPF